MWSHESWLPRLAAGLFLFGAPGCVLFGPGASSNDDKKVVQVPSVVLDDYDAAVDGSTSRGNHPSNGADAGAMAVCENNFMPMWTITSAPMLSVGKLPLSSIDTLFTTLGTGGCLKDVTFTASLANDSSCSLRVTAGPYVDTKGRLIVSELELDGTGTCPGFPDAARSMFRGISSSGSSSGNATATLEFAGSVCSVPSSGLPTYCRTGSFDLAIHGSAVDENYYFDPFASDDAGSTDLDLEGVHMKIKVSEECDYFVGNEQCPVVASQ